jgi:hypothetical protein
MVPIAEKLGGRVLEHDGKLLNYADIPLDADLLDLTLEEILEVAGGHIKQCGAFNAICEEAGIYQMWTEEYVSTLGRYLLDRSSNFDGETVVVDVGAGDGLLVRFLNEFVQLESKRSLTKPKQQKRPKSKGESTTRAPKIVATDDGSWGIFAKADVENMNMKDSIVKYGRANDDDKVQLIVLCSWMPMGVDWSAFFREKGVNEYILIGEADDGTCGDNWETWGNIDFAPSDGGHAASTEAEGSETASTEEVSTLEQITSHNLLPLSTLDGYDRWDMDILSQHQFSRFDCAVSRSSKTVSFKKRGR